MKTKMKPGDRVKYIGKNSVYKNENGIALHERPNDNNLPMWEVDFDKGRWPPIHKIGKQFFLEKNLKLLNCNQFTFYFQE